MSESSLQPLSGVFILRCCGGLGNHLNPLYSVLEFCSGESRRLLINSKLALRITDIWDGPFEDFIKPLEPIPPGRRVVLNGGPGRPVLPSRESAVSYGGFIPLRCVDVPDNLPVGVPKMPGAQWGEKLRLKRNFRRAADNLISQLPIGVPLIGVSIRIVNAHPSTRKHSGVDWFIKRMSYILKVIPRAHFFLSVDKATVASQLTSRFPGKVTVQDKQYVYESSSGLAEAVSDLYALGNTHHILYPHKSSFAPHAAFLQPLGRAPTMETSKAFPASNDYFRSLAVRRSS